MADVTPEEGARTVAALSMGIELMTAAKATIEYLQFQRDEWKAEAEYLEVECDQLRALGPGLRDQITALTAQRNAIIEAVRAYFASGQTGRSLDALISVVDTIDAKEGRS